MTTNDTNAEQLRLDENSKKEVPLEHWGPYLSERQWATVREDYSENGDAWGYLTHDQARSRAYRWGEDGLAGISDYHQRLCFAIALWNGNDPILKERLFGLPNGQGNHGEDVKELYYYLDNVPSHYYMQYLYKYPQDKFPYNDLVFNNMDRSKQEAEYELLDTGVFDKDRYFDVYVTYAKKNSEDIHISIEIINRGADAAAITVLPTLWFYNYWQFDKVKPKPLITKMGSNCVRANHPNSGGYYLYHQPADTTFLTENDTNLERLFGIPNPTAFVKDAFHNAVINKTNVDRLESKETGTKYAPVYKFKISAKGSARIYLRLCKDQVQTPFDADFEAIFATRKKEADDFYASVLPTNTTPQHAIIQRQALAGLLWNKQYYHYDTRLMVYNGRNTSPAFETRPNGRNSNWKYLKNQDVISMPDKWEYPWYAAWDLAFHCVPMALVDPVFAKNQLILIMREWYMNPEGQIPAYEWNFSDVNPPVQAWAALQVYRIEKEKKGTGDITFLKRVFQKLVVNFTWWANQKDVEGNNIFSGGFLGLDNIGVFDRSTQIKDSVLEQVDGTSWMGTFALNMMDIAIEIALVDEAFEDMAVKFYEHFVLIAEALNELGLWDNEDQFFYDTLRSRDGTPYHLKVRSLVGLTSMFAVSLFHLDENDQRLKDFRKRAGWLNRYREQNKLFLPLSIDDKGNYLLSLVPFDRLLKLIDRIADEDEFLSKGGIRALSKYHLNNPYHVNIGGTEYSVAYEPGDSTSNLFGGNSNWRGPIWIPMNFMIINALKKYALYYGDETKINFPKGSDKQLTLHQVADELSKRLISIFETDSKGERPVNGSHQEFYKKPENADLILFYEYFHGDDGHGLGASHQTGWTALIANLVNDVFS